MAPKLQCQALANRPPFRNNARLVLLSTAGALLVFLGIQLLLRKSRDFAPDFLASVFLYGLTVLNLTLLLILVLVLPLVFVALIYADEVPHLVELVREMLAEGLPGPPSWIASIPLVGESLDTGWRELAGNRAKLAELLKRLLQPAREPTRRPRARRPWWRSPSTPRAVWATSSWPGAAPWPWVS